METITAKELAERLNGREYGLELTKEEEELAKKSGLLVIFWRSDDLVELRGIIKDETDAYGGKRGILIAPDGILTHPYDPDDFGEDFDLADENFINDMQNFILRRKRSISIDALWTIPSIATKVPHEKFCIFDGGEIYCEGIVLKFPQLSSPFCDHNCNECPLLMHPNARILTKIFNEAHAQFGDAFYHIVQSNCPNLTCCYDCRIDDFVHVEGCQFQPKGD